MSAGPSFPDPDAPAAALPPEGAGGEGVFGEIPELTAPRADLIAPPFPGLDRALGWLARACMVVAGVQIVTLVLLMGWLVFGRYILNDTPTWIEQMAILLIAWITFLGAAIGVRDESHLSIDFIRESLPPVPRAVLRVLADVMVVIFCALMSWQGWKLVQTNLSREIPMLGLPEAWRYAALVAFGVLGLIFAAVRLAQRAVAPTRSLPWD